ncbi:cytochrome P450 [Xylaria acuta]|nr:cytochrome P450 [Xylaria acuta]
MGSLLLSVAGVLAVIALIILDKVLTLPYDRKEPPLVPPKLPLIGHIIGMLHSGTDYYSELAKRCKQPIFTLNLPRAKMYVVTLPSLVAACDRQARVISFAPYVVDFARRILVTSQHGIDLLSKDLLEENGPVGLRPETLKAISNSLMPGESLEELTRGILEHVSSFLESPSNIGEGKDVHLFHWTRQFLSLASTDVMYGPKNPMRNSKVMDAFWATDKDFALLGLMVLPNLIAPVGSRGRKLFFAAFREYYTGSSLNEASNFVKARYTVNRKHGVTLEDIAQFDLGVCTGLLVNSVPAICWTFCHVYSNRTLLGDLRRGIEAVVFRKGRPLKSSTTTVNIPQVTRDFPLLGSLVKEVLRIQSNNASARFLLQDTRIQDGDGLTYLLKKDAFLVVPSAPIHNNQDIWGPTAHSFDPIRFLRQEGHKGSGATYRTFGGGNALCPGRHLALHEITGTLIMMVLKYDLDPLEGIWEIPRTRHHFSTSILTPVKDILVRIKPRKDVSHISWKFVWEPERVER